MALPIDVPANLLRPAYVIVVTLKYLKRMSRRNKLNTCTLLTHVIYHQTTTYSMNLLYVFYCGASMGIYVYSNMIEPKIKKYVNKTKTKTISLLMQATTSH